MQSAVEELEEIMELTDDHKTNIMDVFISDIIILDRKRDIIEARIEVLKDSISSPIGLMQPIVITQDNILVAGGNRIEACSRLGWITIPATVKQYDSLDAELAEIDENLIRFELTDLERAIQYARRKEIYENKKLKAVRTESDDDTEEDESGEVGNPGFRDSSNTSPSKSFVHDTAEKTGRSTTQVRDEANLGKALLRLPAEIRGLIAPTKSASNKKDLERLVDEPDSDIQLEAARMVNEAFKESKNLSVAEALSTLHGKDTYESSVSENGEATLQSALKKNTRTLDISVNSPNFKSTAETWTYEGLEEIREDFYRIENLAQRGAAVLTEIMEAKEKLGKAK